MTCTWGQRKIPIKFFYGRIMNLRFDLARTTWADLFSIMDYSTYKVGQWSDVDIPLLYRESLP
jgi:hypothetical protein